MYINIVNSRINTKQEEEERNNSEKMTNVSERKKK